jgi:hypothetical protein
VLFNVVNSRSELKGINSRSELTTLKSGSEDYSTFKFAR